MRVIGLAVVVTLGVILSALAADAPAGKWNTALDVFPWLLEASASEPEV